MRNHPYSKLLFFLLLMLLSVGGIFAFSPFIDKNDRLSQLEERLEALPQVALDTIISQGSNARTFADIEIPIRTGFPFCETFIGFDPRDNIEFGGINNTVQLTGNSLQLTSNSQNENGYVFVDIPFSSAFGLKVAFEFSNYGGSGADGVSFFMFDGSISSGDFQIGGTGGALGYTAVRATANEATLISPGLRGAYLGIGFDELGNFGNSRTGKFGGFDDPNNDDVLTGTNLFPHSVVVRGPVDENGLGIPFKDRDRINSNVFNPGLITAPRFESYKFIDGRIFDPASTGTYGLASNQVNVPQYLHPEKFEIDTDAFSGSCPDEGFRKVFIDLNPIDVNDRSQGYTIEVQMLINVGGTVKLVNVFNGPINYPFGAPELLKVGFAAATGINTNFHEIRNVTVQVSNEGQLQRPLVDPLNEEVCEGETNTFELEVELINDIGNAFVRCLQLYYSEAEAEAVVIADDINIPFPPATNGELCTTGDCNDLLCRPERTSRPGYDNITGELAGQFEVFLSDEAGVEVPKVRFLAEPGYSGETTMYYTVTDNFGEVSDPKPITIIINPTPNPVITTLDPLVWEQQEIANINVLLTIQSFEAGDSFKWFKDGVEIPGAIGSNYTATAPGDYTAEVTTDQGCIGISEEEVTILIVENLDPNFNNSPIRETCQELGKITVGIVGIAVTGVDSNGNLGNEKWRILTAAGNIVVDWTFLATGQNTIDYGGLPAGDYVFQIGDEFRTGQPGSDGQPLYRHELTFTILPIENPLQINSVLVEDELCFGEGGIITVEGTGGDGAASYVFSIIDSNTSISYTPTSVTGAQAVFVGLPQGSYTVDLKSGTRCQVIQNEIISGPASPLSITLIASDGTSCNDVTSAYATWEVSGGTPNYTFVSLTKDGAPVSNPTFSENSGVFEFVTLTVGEYLLTVKDANNCEITSQLLELTDLPTPVFETSDVTICEGESASLEVNILELSNSIPNFLWTNHEGTPITGNITSNGVSYTLQDDGDPTTPEILIVSGLAPGSYDFTLNISGTNICNQPDQVAKIFVAPYPVIDDVVITNLSCFQSNDGQLEVLLGPGLVATDFSYELIGFTGLQDSNIFQNLAIGSYQIKVVNKLSNCETIVSNLTINEPDLLEAIDLVVENPTCDQSNGTLSFIIQGGTLNYLVKINGLDISTFDFTNSGNSYQVNALDPGNYVIEVIDANSCTYTSSPVTLINDPLDPITVDAMSLLICEGDPALFTPVVNTPGSFALAWFKDQNATEPISNSPTPDGDGLIYQIDALSGQLIVNGLLEGQYEFYLLVSGPDLCPRVPYLAAVEVLPPLGATLDIQDEICFGASDGSILVNATGADGIYEYSIGGAPFSTVNLFTGLAPGVYSIGIRSSNGCSFSLTGEVLGPDGNISVNTPNLLRASCDLPNGSIENLVISGGWGGYSVSWNQGSVSGPSVNGDLVGAYDLFPGDYYLTVTDSKGCSEIFDFQIEASSDPVYQLVPTVDVCEGTPVEIRPIHIAPDPSLPPAAFTEVRWFKSAGQQDEVIIGQDPDLPGVTYTIDDSDWLNPRLGITGLPAGTYTYYFYVVCTGVELESTITVLPIPQVQVSATSVSCFSSVDGKILISQGSDPNYSYSLNGGAAITQSDLESLEFAPGIYSLVVSQNGVGCPSPPIQVEILQPDTPLSIGPINTLDPSCGASNGVISGQISGGWKNYTVNLFDSGNLVSTQISNNGDFTFTGLLPGDFSVEVEDNRGCVVSSALVILVPGPTRINVADVVICEGEQVTLIPNLEPSSSSATVTWYFDSAKSQIIVSSPSPSADGKIYQISSNGTLTIDRLDFTDSPVNYYTDVTGPDICAGFTASPEVIIKNLPEFVVNVENVSCFGGLGEIVIDASEGNGSFTYSIDGVNFGNNNVFQVDPGTYTAYVQSGGCLISQGNIQVLGPSSPLLLANSGIINPNCNDNDGQLVFDFSGGYSSGYTLNLFRSTVLVQTETSAAGSVTFTNLEAGTYTLELSDGSCVVTSEEIVLIGISTPVSALPTIICEGEIATLVPSTTQQGINPQWNWFKDPNGNQPIISGSSDGSVQYTIQANGTLNISGLSGQVAPYTYYVGISGLNICPPAILPVTVNVNGIPNLRVSNPATVCDPTESVDLTVFIEGFNPNIFDYQIESPDGNLMRLDEIDQVSLSGDYQVRNSFKGLNCWSPTKRIRVIISDEELITEFQYEADLGGGFFVPNAQAQIFEDVLFEDISLGKILFWNWDFGDGNTSSLQNPVHQFQQKGVYIVNLNTIDEFGCVAEYQRTIEVLDDYLVIVPNAFTPTGAKNLFFKPSFRGIVSLEFLIFNTWGELIYEFSGVEDQGWDGTVNGVNASGGNYVYRGRFISASGEVIEKTDVFVLIR